MLSPESPVPDFSGFFYSTNSCMLAGGEAEKDLCVEGFLPLFTLPAWRFAANSYLPPTPRKDPFSFC